MTKEYTKEQLWKLYEKLPEELQEAIFAEETANSIWDICERNKVEQVSKAAKYTGWVLMGILPPEEFQETLEKELELKKEVAKKVAQEINRFVFYPVKPALEELYKMGVKSSEKPIEKQKTEAMPEEEKVPAPPRKDIYREPLT